MRWARFCFSETTFFDEKNQKLRRGAEYEREGGRLDETKKKKKHLLFDLFPPTFQRCSRATARPRPRPASGTASRTAAPRSEYGPATPGRPRLSFTYYELVDFAAFPGAVAALLALARDFRARTGWAPGALAVYFVRRGGNKEASNYAGPKGISCTLDPVTVRGTEVFGFFFSRSLSFLSFFLSFFQRLASFFFPSSKGSPLCSLETPSPSLHPLLLLSLSLSLQGAPGDPRFRQFLAESDALIQSLGGRLSPSQSLPSALDGGNRDAAADFGGLDQSLVSGAGGDRFATPYLRRVFAADARAQELKKAGMWEAAVGAQRG